MRQLINSLASLLSTASDPVVLDVSKLLPLGYDPAMGSWPTVGPTVAAEVSQHGHTVLPYPGGLLAFPGLVLEGSEHGDWKAQGTDAAEDAVIRLLSPVRTSIPRVAASLLAHSDRDAVLSRFSLKLSYFARGVVAAGLDGEAARAEAEAVIWAAFESRLRVLANVKA